jgi:hypothetical protein
MKPPSNVARPATTISGPSIRLPAKDLAQVRAIAATVVLRTNSRRKPLLFIGAHALAAAEAMAAILRRNLLTAGLSSVVSQFIGETEKNLDQVFDEAEASGAILLFDEADALFGKRSDVKDARDRFIELAVDDLLRHTGQYGGLVILVSRSGPSLSMLLRRRFLTYDFPPRRS